MGKILFLKHQRRNFLHCCTYWKLPNDTVLNIGIILLQSSRTGKFLFQMITVKYRRRIFHKQRRLTVLGKMNIA